MMMKGRTTTNNVQLKKNQSIKNGKRDQMPQRKKKNGGKRSSEEERLIGLGTKEESNVSLVEVVNDKATQLYLSEKDETVNDSAKDDQQEEEEEERKDFDAIANEKMDSASCSETCEGVNVEKTMKACDHALSGGLSDGNQNKEGDNVKEISEDEEALIQKVVNLEARIEKLEEELREVAALEISLYSVVPDHSSSAHKLHTPARRISRVYIYACKHWSQGKRATVARNTVSGLILVAKSCGNDVSRLTFWLSNIIALREIISQAFNKSHVPSHFTQTSESNRSEQSGSGKLRMKYSQKTKPVFEEWQETETFTGALEKVEFWIFSRIVESVWWQVFTPHMQSPKNGDKTNEKLVEPVLVDHDQGSFSISLWENAFKVALSRLCPVRGAGHECGCLPILSKMVMEKCIARVDVAMFNAILRESEHQIPTDPVSDPILDSKVLPIPSGDLSFGSGARLKNAIGNWSRCLDEMFDINTKDSSDSKAFALLNELSDLLMLPKDMLLEKSIREEVCPSISLPVIKRILCNFTPDEFCPDHVPGTVLEELNAESTLEQKLSGVSFPYAASSVSYLPPSSLNETEEIAEVGGGEGGESCKLLRNVSMIHRKGYTSDEELEELDSPLESIVDKVSVSMVSNSRYELLKDVWFNAS